MPKTRLLAYVQKKLAVGETEDVIAQALKARRWSDEEIKKAFASLKERPNNQDTAIPDRESFSIGSKKLPIVISIGLVGACAGILLKALDIIPVSWEFLTLYVAAYLPLHWFVSRKNARYGVWLLVTVLTIIGASLLSGVFTDHPTKLTRPPKTAPPVHS